MTDGRLVTVEGLDGAGKTTLSRGLAGALRERGVNVRELREPGSVAAAERIRALVADPGLELGARAEALLFAAARAQLVEEELAPALARGELVLLDRFLDSSLAYQGGGRELGVDAVRAVNAFGLGGLVPDQTLLVRVPLAVGRARVGGKDRMEREDEAFFARVDAAYAALAAAEPARVRVLDGTAPPDAVLAAALGELGDLL